MFKLFSKNYLTAVLALLSLNTMNSSLMAEDCCYCCESNTIYIGGFGGGLYSNSTKMRQTGTVFFLEAEGGPLAVDARGRAHKKSSGFGGVQIGYEWSRCPLNMGYSNWSVTPAAEVEAYFYSHTKKGHLINPTNRLPEHDFLDSFRMNAGVYLVNGVISLKSCCLGNFSPCVGGGIGAADLSLRKADSLQVAPVEAGINHFNSKRNDSAWAFAAQVKAGFQYKIGNRFRFFCGIPLFVCRFQSIQFWIDRIPQSRTYLHMDR